MRRGEKVPPAQNLEGARAKGPAGAPADTLATLLQEHQDVLLRRRILVEADPDGEGARGAAAPAGPTPDGAADAAGLHPYFARAHALDDLSALCLSGGGIRSAAFALGAIQSLARRQLLHRFDYLSTVSGGGYIGSWLMSWVQRRGYEAVLAGLRSDREPDRTSPLAYLWRYSNYLTPHTGLFSADTLTIVALYVRNLLLNWLVIMPLILSAIALAKLAALTAWGIDPAHAGTLAMLAITLVGSALLDFLLQRPGWENMRSTRLAFWMTNLLPMLLGSFLASVAGIKYLAIVEYVDPPWPSIAVTLSLAGALICALAWLLAFYFARLSPRAGEPGARVPAPSVRTTVASASREDPVIGYVAWAAVSYALSGIVFGLVLTGILWLLHGPVEALAPLRPNGPSDLRGLLLVCFGPAIVVGAIFFGELIYVGLTSDAPWADAEREWLARAGGHYAFVAWIWAAGFVVVLGGSAVVGSFAFPNAVGWFAGSGGAAAILIALLGKASSTAAFVRDEIKTWKNLSARFVLAIVTPVFIVCLLALLSAGFDWIVFGKAGVVLPSEAASAASPLSLLAWFFGILVFGLAISRFVNINRFSLHSVYRNRLIRTFLGASRRDRAPNPFTGFDERDNIALQDSLAAEAGRARQAAAAASRREHRAQRPEGQRPRLPGAPRLAAHGDGAGRRQRQPALDRLDGHAAHRLLPAFAGLCARPQGREGHDAWHRDDALRRRGEPEHGLSLLADAQPAPDPVQRPPRRLARQSRPRRHVELHPERTEDRGKTPRLRGAGPRQRLPQVRLSLRRWSFRESRPLRDDPAPLPLDRRLRCGLRSEMHLRGSRQCDPPHLPRFRRQDRVRGARHQAAHRAAAGDGLRRRRRHHLSGTARPAGQAPLPEAGLPRRRARGGAQLRRDLPGIPA